MDRLPPEIRAKLGEGVPEDGAYVSSVVPDGPAARAGLQEGDVITAIGGERVVRPNDVIDAVSRQKIGAKVTLDYVRGGKRRTAGVTLAEMPTGDEQQQQRQRGGGQEPRLGIGLQTLTDPLARSLGVPAGTKGAVITEVRPGSPAARAGLAPGEVIVEVDRKKVASADEAAALISAGDKKPRLLRVMSAAGIRFVTITPE